MERPHCVNFAFKSFAHLTSRCSVKWFTDNQAVALIIDSGSMKQHQLAVDIFHTAKENNIEIEAVWMTRSLNEKADYLNKIVNCDDWTVKDSFFHAVTYYWVPVQGIFFADSFRSFLIPVLWVWIS